MRMVEQAKRLERLAAGRRVAKRFFIDKAVIIADRQHTHTCHECAEERTVCKDIPNSVCQNLPAQLHQLYK